MTCQVCGSPMTVAEQTVYRNRCENCFSCSDYKPTTCGVIPNQEAEIITNQIMTNKEKPSANNH